MNLEKSKLYCSPNLPKQLAKDISQICGSPLANDLSKYLGMSLIHSRVSKSTCADIFDKVQNRMSSWKSSTLNIAGRLTLIQAVNASISVFAMQSAKLPVSVCNSLDNLNRDFLWETVRKKRRSIW